MIGVLEEDEVGSGVVEGSGGVDDGVGEPVRMFLPHLIHIVHSHIPIFFLLAHNKKFSSFIFLKIVPKCNAQIINPTILIRPKHNLHISSNIPLNPTNNLTINIPYSFDHFSLICIILFIEDYF